MQKEKFVSFVSFFIKNLPSDKLEIFWSYYEKNSRCFFVVENKSADELHLYPTRNLHFEEWGKLFLKSEEFQNFWKNSLFKKILLERIGKKTGFGKKKKLFILPLDELEEMLSEWEIKNFLMEL